MFLKSTLFEGVAARYPNGSTYTGEWLGPHRHGHGLQVWPDGARYEGWAIDDLGFLMEIGAKRLKICRVWGRTGSKIKVSVDLRPVRPVGERQGTRPWAIRAHGRRHLRGPLAERQGTRQRQGRVGRIFDFSIYGSNIRYKIGIYIIYSTVQTL